MPAPRECRRRRQWGLIGEGDERAQIRVAMADDSHRQGIDKLFARHADPPDNPPHRRMKPEDAASQLLAEDPCPVTASNVPQLVCQYGCLDVIALDAKSLR